MLYIEKPTPVSALIHAATMVTAGVFLLIRSCYLVDSVPAIQKLILIIGAITAFFAGSIGIVQMDLKKVIAYSTCSQLGFMIVACGLGAYDVALFHLAMHAFFKALLFLSAGSIIHAFFYDEQDIRRLGGGLKYLPVTYISFLIGSLALMGFPYLSGFYSKDLILEILLVSTCPISQFAVLFCFLAVGFTTFYSMRLIYFVFFSYNRLTLSVLDRTHESSYFILIPLILLSFFSIGAGYCSRDVFVNLAYLTGGYRTALLSSPYYYVDSYKFNMFLVEELDIMLKLLSFFIVFFITLFTLYLYIFGSSRVVSFFMTSHYPRKFTFFVHRFLIKKWYFDIVYAHFTRYVLRHGYVTLLVNWDRGFLEWFGPYGNTIMYKHVTDYIRTFQNGLMGSYMFMFFVVFCIGVCFFLNWIIQNGN